MAGKDYDVAAAFQAIEYELINSFFRNMKKHKVDEVKEQKQWEMWQVKQLQELDLYKKRNAEKYGTKFTDINKTIAEMIRLSNEEGQMDQEAEILSAMEKGLKPQRAPEQMTAQFFRTNDRKLDTLINATVSDMERAEVAVLRKADDVYRKTIFNAMVYANTGAGTYEKAIDMATKDFMKAGLTCVEYKNGSKHTISDYADMAVRTANKRAYLQGEGAKRQEWGVHTVIVNKRLMACPHCMPFAGKVFIDDVWGGGTAADGDYPLLSEAVAAGLYHPRCKDSHTAYFPGITGKPKKYTKAEVKEAEKVEEQERKADYAERQVESYQRLADTRLDPENKRVARSRTDLWKEKAQQIMFEKEKKENEIIRSDMFSAKEITDNQRTIHSSVKETQRTTSEDLLTLSINLLNNSDPLLERMLKVEPIIGFEDVYGHGDAYSMILCNMNAIENGNISANDVLDWILKSGSYKGGNIRLLACSTGKEPAVVPRYLAKKLNVLVMAPSEDVNVDFDGKIILADDPKDAKMNINTGEWLIFKPDGSVMKYDDLRR